MIIPVIIAYFCVKCHVMQVNVFLLLCGDVVIQIYSTKKGISKYCGTFGLSLNRIRSRYRSHVKCVEMGLLDVLTTGLKILYLFAYLQLKQHCGKKQHHVRHTSFKLT